MFWSELFSATTVNVVPCGRVAQYRMVYERAPEHVNPRHCVHRIEAKRCEDEPRGDLPAVVVARYPLRRVVVKPRNLPHSLLRLPWRACEVVEIRNVVAWLVTLCILAHHAGDIGRRLENVWTAQQTAHPALR